MIREFESLKRDYDSSSTPNPYDPITIRTLCSIVNNIHKKNYGIATFEDFVDKELGKGYFAKECKSFVSHVISYLNSN